MERERERKGREEYAGQLEREGEEGGAEEILSAVLVFGNKIDFVCALFDVNFFDTYMLFVEYVDADVKVVTSLSFFFHLNLPLLLHLFLTPSNQREQMISQRRRRQAQNERSSLRPFSSLLSFPLILSLFSSFFFHI